MIHTNSDSDVTSVSSSSLTSSKRPVYYVQSPSRDSHDGTDKSQATPLSNSPTDSPSRPSTLASSASRISGTYRSAKVNQKHNGKGWHKYNSIEEEGDYYESYGDDVFTRQFKCLIVLLAFVSISILFCLIIWGASRPYKPQVAMKSLTVNNFYYGVGSDYTGVPTKLLTVNCSVKMMINNLATFFSIHVSSSVDLSYHEITVATGKLKKYYQPRKSQRIVLVNLEGNKVPLYGAGTSIVAADIHGGVPLRLKLEIQSYGNLIGKLVKTKHRRLISCSLTINSRNTKEIKFKNHSCTCY
ncbi:hypothetical protein NMG60_11021875 [Bertholletia excelsa]